MAKLSNQENVYFTDEYVVTYADFSAVTTDNATKTFTYAVPAGSLVTAASAHLRTAFDDSGAGDELDVIVGVTGGDVDGLLASAAVHVDQTEITYVANTGALIDNENGTIFTTAGSIAITFTPNASTGTDYALSELTAGEIVFRFAIIDLDPNA
jgi:hypothetical protein